MSALKTLTAALLAALVLAAGTAYAEVFEAGGTATAAPSPAEPGMVVISTTIPGAVTADLYPGGKKPLPVAVRRGQKFQLQDGQGRWLCIDSAGFCGQEVTLVGVTHACPKDYTDCAMRVNK